MKILNLFSSPIYAAVESGSGGGKVTSSGDIIPSYGETNFRFENKTIGEIVGGPNGLLGYIYVAAGLVLLLMLITGGIGLMTSGGNPDKMKAGYGRITSALIGFLIVFVSYIVVQVVERIFGLDIL